MIPTLNPRLELHDILKELLVSLDNSSLLGTSVIRWASPIISFGDINKAILATLGLNPSNLEFLDKKGNELQGQLRRFHSLNSLGLKNWSDILDADLDEILEKCFCYFRNNPYDNWFKKLDYLISGCKFSYYFPFGNACHLDLVPFTTANKWGELSPRERSALFKASEHSLGKILKYSQIQTLVLNGRSVLDGFQEVAQITLTETLMPSWSLPRKNANDILGFAYEGFVDRVGDVCFNRKIKVLGFNHNIQSSFGVTSRVQAEIRNWIKTSVNI